MISIICHVAGWLVLMLSHVPLSSSSSSSSSSKEQGLLVNTKKTALLAISGANSFEARAHIYSEDGTRVDSQKEMRILGYTFNNKADASSQVNVLAKKFRCKMWTLRELRKAGFSEAELLAVYKSAIRPILEFSSVIYHSLLTNEQSEFLETLQYNALKKHIWLRILQT